MVDRVRNRLRSWWRIVVSIPVSILLSMLVVPVVGPDHEAVAADSLLLVDRFRPEIGALGPATVIGDSVLLGSVYSPWGTTLDDHLVARGWGPIRVRAGVGDSTTTAARWISTWRSQGWDAPNVLVNLGANDSNGCAGDETCSYAAIMRLVDTVGPGVRVWWPKITRHPVLEHHAAGWNRALDRVAAERPGRFVTWDWPSVMYAMGDYASDHTHMTSTGYLERSRLMALRFTADLAVATRSGSVGPDPARSGLPSEYVPLRPQRIVDTRIDAPGRLGPGGQLVVDLTPWVPPGTTSVAVNLTTTETFQDGFLTAFACGSARPLASSVNHAAGRSRGAMAIVPLSASGRLCVHSHAGGHVIVDLQGAFVPSAFVPSGGARFTPLDRPTRLLDTRITGRGDRLEIPVDDDATAVAITLTAVGATRNGWLRADDCAGSTTVSNVNFGAGEAVAGAAIVPVSSSGTICVVTSSPVDVVADITGTFSDGGDLRFQAASPRRMVDLRDGTGGWRPLIGKGQSIRFHVAPAGAVAVTGTITLVAPYGNAWARADSCGAAGATSNVNASASQVMANSVTTGLGSDGDLCITTNAASAVLFDTTGWWIP